MKYFYIRDTDLYFQNGKARHFGNNFILRCINMYSQIVYFLRGQSNSFDSLCQVINERDRGGVITLYLAWYVTLESDQRHCLG